MSAIKRAVRAVGRVLLVAILVVFLLVCRVLIYSSW